jgi:hypothetical protein
VTDLLPAIFVRVVSCPGSLCPVEQAPDLHFFSSSGVCSRRLILDSCTRPFARADRRDRVSLSESRIFPLVTEFVSCSLSASLPSAELPVRGIFFTRSKASSRSLLPLSPERAQLFSGCFCSCRTNLVNNFCRSLCVVSCMVYLIVFLSRRFKRFKFSSRCCTLVIVLGYVHKVFDEMSVRSQVAL